MQKAEPFSKRFCYVKNIEYKRISDALWHKYPPLFWVAKIKDFALRDMCCIVLMVLCFTLNALKVDFIKQPKARKITENKWNMQIFLQKICVFLSVM